VCVCVLHIDICWVLQKFKRDNSAGAKSAITAMSINKLVKLDVALGKCGTDPPANKKAMTHEKVFNLERAKLEYILSWTDGYFESAAIAAENPCEYPKFRRLYS